MALPYPDEDRERRQRGLRIQRSLQKETNSRILDDDMSDSDVGDIDFTKEIHPIGHHIDDREKMIEEMFSILKGEKLQRILPAVLKNYTIEELKADCLVHLLGMSKKRIFAILEGRDLNSSSDSETDDENVIDERERLSSKGASPEVLDSKTKTKTTKAEKEARHRSRKRKSSIKDEAKLNDSVSPFIVISDDETVDVKPLREERKTFLKLREERRVLNAKIVKKMKKTEKRKIRAQMQEIQVIEDSNDEQEAVQNVSEEEEQDNDDNEDKGKSLLEILELEMRARAIRALLMNTPDADEPVPVSILNIKPEPHSTVETEINRTIAEVINEESGSDKPHRDLSSPTDDVEISEVCDILTVLIDDDEDEPESTPTPTSMPSSINNESNEERKSKQANIHSSELPSKNITKKDEKETENKEDVTWSERWMESKGVKDVMKNNKICANIRKRMRFARMLKEKQSQEQEKAKEREKDDLPPEVLSSLSNVEESSIAQYELIKSLHKPKPTNEGTADQSPSGSEELTTVHSCLEANNEEITVQEGVLNSSSGESEKAAVVELMATDEEHSNNTCNDVPID